VCVPHCCAMSAFPWMGPMHLHSGHASCVRHMPCVLITCLSITYKRVCIPQCSAVSAFPWIGLLHLNSWHASCVVHMQCTHHTKGMCPTQEACQPCRCSDPINWECNHGTALWCTHTNTLMQWMEQPVIKTQHAHLNCAYAILPSMGMH